MIGENDIQMKFAESVTSEADRIAALKNCMEKTARIILLDSTKHFPVFKDDHAQFYGKIDSLMQTIMNKMGRHDLNAHLISFMWAANALAEKPFGNDFFANEFQEFKVNKEDLHAIAVEFKPHQRIKAEAVVEFEAAEKRKAKPLSISEWERNCVIKPKRTKAKAPGVVGAIPASIPASAPTAAENQPELVNLQKLLLAEVQAYQRYIENKCQPNDNHSDGHDAWNPKRTLMRELSRVLTHPDNVSNNLIEFKEIFNRDKDKIITNPDESSAPFLRTVAYVFASILTGGLFNIARIGYRAWNNSTYVSFSATFSGEKFVKNIEPKIRDVPIKLESN